MLAVVVDTWVRELRDPDTIYTEVEPRDLFAHLQAGCTGRHALDLLALHNEMQRYHLEVKGIPEYINMLEDAQRQAGWAGRTISDETLLLFSSTAILTSERFPRANNDWEDQAELDKTWAAWKLAYKQAHAMVRVKAQAHEGSTNFGAANSATRPEDQIPLDTQHEGGSGDIQTLEGYFDNLVEAATNKKDVLNQLVLNNTTLTNSNESLVSLVKKQANNLKNLEQELARLLKTPSQRTEPPDSLLQLQKGWVPPTPRLLRASKKQRQAPPRVAKRFVKVGDGKQE